MKLKDIYRPDTVTIDVDDDLATAARRMELARVGALAVVDEAGQLVGIFTERDLVRATARAANPADVLVSAPPRSDRRRPMSRRIPATSPAACWSWGSGICQSPSAMTSWSGWSPCATCWPSRPGCREASWM
jgi:CBS-domain-containing membrane protein